MFWRKKKQPESTASQGLKLVADDRDSFSSTKVSTILAREVLEQAKQEMISTGAKTDIVVELAENRSDVHYMELIFDLMHLCGEYGVEFVSVSDNQITFRAA